MQSKPEMLNRRSFLGCMIASMGAIGILARDVLPLVEPVQTLGDRFERMRYCDFLKYRSLIKAQLSSGEIIEFLASEFNIAELDSRLGNLYFSHSFLKDFTALNSSIVDYIISTSEFNDGAVHIGLETTLRVGHTLMSNFWCGGISRPKSLNMNVDCAIPARRIDVASFVHTRRVL